MDRGKWWATVLGVAKSDMTERQLTFFTFNTISTYYLTSFLVSAVQLACLDALFRVQGVGQNGFHLEATRARISSQGHSGYWQNLFLCSSMTVVSGILLSVSWRLILSPRDCDSFLLKQVSSLATHFIKSSRGVFLCWQGLVLSLISQDPSRKIILLVTSKSHGPVHLQSPSCLTFSVC